MIRPVLTLLLMLSTIAVYAQEKAIEELLTDTCMMYGSAAILIVNTDSGERIAAHDPSKSLKQASVMKLITTAAALKILGPDYTFITTLGYTGSLNSRNGVLKGDLIIRGGGDPSLGSEYFAGHYGNFIEKWTGELMTTGIRKVKGRVIADDSRYDYQPVPPGWNWEDIGNYYGAGVYGISLFDNTLKIHFSTGDKGSVPEIKSMEPENSGLALRSFLTSSGTSDQGYVYSAPYTSSGWISGTIPVNKDDFVLKASIPDPPMLLATLLKSEIGRSGIKVTGEATTARISGAPGDKALIDLFTTSSPPLSSLMEVLNHESVNLYAEHLLKEIGKYTRNEGTLNAGIRSIRDFLDTIGIDTDGMFIDDGSGLSPQDAVNPEGMVRLLTYMQSDPVLWPVYYNSLPDAGKEGTLKNYFRDSVFEGRLRAKSGTLTRSKAYAGYMTTVAGNNMAFCIIVNNFTGPSGVIISHIENILRDVILYK